MATSGWLWGNLTSKGHTDLVFGLSTGFTGRSVHTRLQVSVCCSYDMWHQLTSWQTHTNTHQL